MVWAYENKPGILCIMLNFPTTKTTTNQVSLISLGINKVSLSIICLHVNVEGWGGGGQRESVMAVSYFVRHSCSLLAE